MGDRLTAGQRALNPFIQVRILVPQPINSNLDARVPALESYSLALYYKLTESSKMRKNKQDIGNPFKIILALIFTTLLLNTTTAQAAATEATMPSDARVISHNISITVNLNARSLHGTDTIKVEGTGGSLRLLLNKNVTITRLRSKGKRPYRVFKNIAGKPLKELIIKLPRGPMGSKPITIHMSFNATMASIKTAERKITRGISYVNEGVMGRRGVFLPSSSFWYPHTEEGTAQYNLSINMPRGYTTVSEGDWMLHMNSADRTFDRWKTTRPVDGLDIVASKFHVKKSSHNGINLYTFFLKKETKLSETYIKKTAEYLDLYGELFGKYPFMKFAVVESFLPTGYGMPSFTLLGSRVLRLPFIPDTSLGHEIAHSWWGNSVYIDASLGNWSEALTTYTADYLYERKKGDKDAAEFRFKKLEGYKNFASPDGPSLHDFVEATETAERAVGYNKGIMVFVMLEDLLDSDTFNKSLKNFYEAYAFKRATWGDIAGSFSKTSGVDLTWFFKQWLHGVGGPRLVLSGVSTKKSEQGYVTSFSIDQDEPAYTLTLPLRLSTAEDGKVIQKNLEITQKKNDFSITTALPPAVLELDPEYRVFRILSPSEVPPSLSVVIGDKDALIVLADDAPERAKFSPGAELLSKDYELKISDEGKDEIKKTLEKKSLFLLCGTGITGLMDKMELSLPDGLSIDDNTITLGDKTYETANTALAVAIKNPYNAEKNIVFFRSKATTSSEILKEIKKIRFYTKYSYILLQKGEVIEKGFLTVPNALSYRFKADDLP